MGLVANLRVYGRVITRRRYQRTPDLVRLLARRPAIAVGISAYEAGLLVSGRVDAPLKALAVVKSSALVGCPF